MRLDLLLCVSYVKSLAPIGETARIGQSPHAPMKRDDLANRFTEQADVCDIATGVNTCLIQQVSLPLAQTMCWAYEADPGRGRGLCYVRGQNTQRDQPATMPHIRPLDAECLQYCTCGIRKYDWDTKQHHRQHREYTNHQLAVEKANHIVRSRGRLCYGQGLGHSSAVYVTAIQHDPFRPNVSGQEFKVIMDTAEDAEMTREMVIFSVGLRAEYGPYTISDLLLLRRAD